MSVQFFTEDIKFRLNNRMIMKKCIRQTIDIELKKMGNLNYIFVSKNKILELNKQYLSHHYSTDIITFDYSESDTISGDMFVCIDQVTENAADYGVTTENELTRVVGHGLLHLLGYDDKSESDQLIMSEKEEQFLERFQELRSSKK